MQDHLYTDPTDMCFMENVEKLFLHYPLALLFWNAAISILRSSWNPSGGGRVLRWCCINFQYRGVLLICIRVGQRPTVVAVGAGGGCLDIFSLIYHFSFLSPSLWETARYRLKCCLKGPLSPKQQTIWNSSTCVN